MESKISAADLSLGSKRLAQTKTKERADSLDYDQGIAERYTKMYEQFNGDLDQLFDELNENPRKAKKYPPSDAHEFGIKYAQGFYACLESEGKEWDSIVSLVRFTFRAIKFI